MVEEYNPYKIALTFLKSKLKEEDIPMVDKKPMEDVVSISDEGFDVNNLKKYLFKTERENFKKVRTSKNYSGHELIQCLRKSFYHRMGAPVDLSNIGLYPFSKIKAIMGHVAERLVLSLMNQGEGTKFKNDIELKWNMKKELGTLYPFWGVIDGLSYDEDIISDVKFTDQESQLHLEQVLIYSYIWEKKHPDKPIHHVEVIYINSAMNTITTKKYSINDEVRKTKFVDIENRILYFDKCLREKTLPREEKDKCDFCNYKKSCVNNEYTTMVDSKVDDDIQILEKPKGLVKGDLKKNKGVQIKMENHPKKDTNIKILL